MPDRCAPPRVKAYALPSRLLAPRPPRIGRGAVTHRFCTQISPNPANGFKTIKTADHARQTVNKLLILVMNYRPFGGLKTHPEPDDRGGRIGPAKRQCSEYE